MLVSHVSGSELPVHAREHKEVKRWLTEVIREVDDEDKRTRACAKGCSIGSAACSVVGKARLCEPGSRERDAIIPHRQGES